MSCAQKFDPIKCQKYAPTNVNKIENKVWSCANRAYINVSINPSSDMKLNFLLDSSADIALINEADVKAHLGGQEIKLLEKDDINVNAEKGSVLKILPN